MEHSEEHLPLTDDVISIVNKFIRDMEENHSYEGVSPITILAQDYSIDALSKIVNETLSVKLSQGFTWRDTNQGHRYWHDIHTKIIKYERKIRHSLRGN